MTHKTRGLLALCAVCFLAIGLSGCQPMVAKASETDSTRNAFAKFDELTAPVESRAAEADTGGGTADIDNATAAAIEELREQMVTLQASITALQAAREAEPVKTAEATPQKSEADLYRETVLGEIARYRGGNWSYDGRHGSLAQHIASEHGITVPDGLTQNQLVKLHSLMHESERGNFATCLVGTRPVQQSQTTVRQFVQAPMVYSYQNCPNGVCPNQAYSYGYTRSNRHDD